MRSLVTQLLLAQVTHVVLQIVPVLLWMLRHLLIEAGDVGPHLPKHLDSILCRQR